MSAAAKRAVATVLVALLVIALDQWTKWLILERVNLDEVRSVVVTGFFKLTMVWNHGISFGMLSHPSTYVPWFLSAVAMGISLVVLVLAMRSEHRLERMAYGVIMGGAMGDVIDRVRFGAVVDFLSFHWQDHYWPAFNIADASIFCGVAVLLWRSVTTKRA